MKIPNRTIRVQNKNDKYFVPAYSLIPTPIFGRVQDQMLSAIMRIADFGHFARRVLLLYRRHLGHWRTLLDCQIHHLQRFGLDETYPIREGVADHG
jgi:hypothetical protein